MFMLRLFSFVLCLLFVSSLQAQKLSVPNNLINLEEVAPQAEYLFQDEEEQILFIDFSKLNDDIRSLNVINDEGTSVLEKDLKSLKKDAIIEINYSGFKKGVYMLKLKNASETLETPFNVSI